MKSITFFYQFLLILSCNHRLYQKCQHFVNNLLVHTKYHKFKTINHANFHLTHKVKRNTVLSTHTSFQPIVIGVKGVLTPSLECGLGLSQSMPCLLSKVFDTHLSPTWHYNSKDVIEWPQKVLKFPFLELRDV